MTPAPEPLLAYTLTTTPDPIRIGAPATLRLVARGGAAPAYCRRITLGVPTGTGAGALTDNPAAITTAPVQGGGHQDQGGGWTIARSTPPGRADFTAIPTAGRGWLAGVTPLTLELGAIAVNAALGGTALTVTEETSADGTDWATRTTELPVPKFSADFVFRYFAPDEIHVPNGDSVRLTWQGSPATYTMRWGRRGECDVGDTREWTSPPLHDTTTFRLTATQPGSTAERVLTTTVTVFRPHLRVRDLSARRNVRMIGADQRLDPPPPDRPLRLRAGTDGILVGHVKAKAGAAPAAISVTAGGTTAEYAQTFTSDNRDTSRVPAETPFHVPVRRGATLDITTEGTADDDFGLTWLPLGTGRLDPAD
ncbi:hypothetical protein [Streptomyces inhibens]|uniref:hypothetical protein n=1 Tax=Streptomyces inhibens TaxID=2293571 RepID=UPI001EE76EAE|nr:hypothetical protein [Streptomyces inhibens]UKY48517.1 hypothetical protein KI385_06705 [Streptomyces inhibens]